MKLEMIKKKFYYFISIDVLISLISGLLYVIRNIHSKYSILKLLCVYKPRETSFRNVKWEDTSSSNKA